MHVVYMETFFMGNYSSETKKKAIIQHRLHFCRYHFSNQILRSCTIKKHRTKLNFSSIVLIRYPWTHNFLQPNHHKNNCNYNYHEQVLPWFLTILRSCTINMTLNDVILLPRANFTIIYHNTVKTIAITIKHAIYKPKSSC